MYIYMYLYTDTYIQIHIHILYWSLTALTLSTEQLRLSGLSFVVFSRSWGARAVSARVRVNLGSVGASVSRPPV